MRATGLTAYGQGPRGRPVMDERNLKDDRLKRFELVVVKLIATPDLKDGNLGVEQLLTLLRETPDGLAELTWP